MYNYVFMSMYFFIALTCSDPPLHNAKNMIVEIPDSLTEGVKVKYACVTRYKLVGDNVLKCKSGKWVGEVPFCKGMYVCIIDFKSISISIKPYIKENY